MFKLAKIIRRDLFFDRTVLSRELAWCHAGRVKIRKFKMLYFLNERRHGTRNLQKDLFLGRLQPGVGKNSKDLAIFILGFDDVTVKTIYRAINKLRRCTRREAAFPLSRGLKAMDKL